MYKKEDAQLCILLFYNILTLNIPTGSLYLLILQKRII